MTRFTSFFAALALLLATATAAHAQADWEAPLAAQLAAFEADASPATLDAVNAAVARIAAAHPDAWLPSYYAARTEQMRHRYAGDDGCAECVDAMDAHLAVAEAADNNSEVMTMRASYYQTMLGLHPMRAPFYGPKAGNLLERAIEADRTNPRAASLLGQNYYYTPAMFGGGVKLAAPLLERADVLYAAEAKTDRGLLPTWGAERNAAMSAKAAAELAE